MSPASMRAAAAARRAARGVPRRRAPPHRLRAVRARAPPMPAGCASATAKPRRDAAAPAAAGAACSLERLRPRASRGRRAAHAAGASSRTLREDGGRAPASSASAPGAAGRGVGRPPARGRSGRRRRSEPGGPARRWRRRRRDRDRDPALAEARDPPASAPPRSSTPASIPRRDRRRWRARWARPPCASVPAEHLGASCASWSPGSCAGIATRSTSTTDPAPCRPLDAGHRARRARPRGAPRQRPRWPATRTRLSCGRWQRCLRGLPSRRARGVISTAR